LGDSIDGSVRKDDTENAVTAFLQQGGEFANVVFFLSKEKKDQQFGQGFFQIVFQS